MSIKARLRKLEQSYSPTVRVHLRFYGADGKFVSGPSDDEIREGDIVISFVPAGPSDVMEKEDRG